MHRHHIIPKHLGGEDTEENLTPPISIQLHALFHKDLWEMLGHPQDYIAWQALSGRITNEEARLLAAKRGQDSSVLYKESRKKTGKRAELSRTRDSCSLGGRKAVSKLLEWQKNNKEKFRNQCSLLGKNTAEKLNLRHSFNGVTYKSKKELQDKTKMCNTTFYKKLRKGQIIRLDVKKKKDVSGNASYWENLKKERDNDAQR